MEKEWQETLSKGVYELLLNLPDARLSLYNRPEYSIKLASTYQSRPVWDAATGWNLLLLSLQVFNRAYLLPLSTPPGFG